MSSVYHNKRTGFFQTNAAPTYWLSRFMILRLLGIVYAIAFLVAINQIIPLIGHDGLTPADLSLRDIGRSLGSTTAGFFRLPSVFWWFHSDQSFLIGAWTGFLLSLIVVAGFANVPILTILWFLYLSFVHVGQEWYGYGWEIQLTETGFLAIFLCPFWDMRSFPKHAPPFVIIVLFRWLIFRIMFGAGLIKIRGDEVWRNGTALYYHFETQPIPGPLSRWFHFLPHSVLKTGVWFNHIAELIAPLFVFGPRIVRQIAGIVIILFQLVIFASGNLSFLNWLTIIPAFACLDDGFWAKVLPRFIVNKAETAAEKSTESRPMKTVAWIVTFLVIILSVQPAFNLLSSQQIMNTSFDPLNLVNTYGAFGSVGKERLNVIFEGTMDDNPTDDSDWKPYVYRGLPVELGERPPQVAPYQLRLDWQMWFAAMGTAEQYPWTYNLVWKLLHNDPNMTGLFARNPFPQHPPKYIRAVLYRYSFAPPGNVEHQWWKREKVGLWMPVLSTKDRDLIKYLRYQEWIRQ